MTHSTVHARSQRLWWMIMYNFYSLSYSYGNIFFLCSPLSSLDLKGFCRVQGGTDQEQQGLLSNSLCVKQLRPLNPVRCLLVNTIKPGGHQIEHNVCNFLLDCFRNLWNVYVFWCTLYKFEIVFALHPSSDWLTSVSQFSPEATNKSSTSHLCSCWHGAPNQTTADIWISDVQSLFLDQPRLEQLWK